MANTDFDATHRPDVEIFASPLSFETEIVADALAQAEIPSAKHSNFAFE